MSSFLTAFLMLVSTELSDEEKTKANDLYPYVFHTDDRFGIDHTRIWTLPEDDRQLLIRWLYGSLRERRIQGGDVELNSSNAHALALLGDDRAIETFAAEYRNRPHGVPDSLLSIRNAKVLPHIGDLLWKEERYQQIDDRGFYPTQGTAAEVFVWTLAKAPQFSAEVWEWGERLRELGSLPSRAVLEILREWYKENKEKLRTEDFKTIRPGRLPAGAATSRIPAEAPIASSVAAVPSVPAAKLGKPGPARNDDGGRQPTSGSSEL